MERLDQYLIRVEELPSREFSREEILKGQVLVNGKKILKPGYKVKGQDHITYLGEGRMYVSRGAGKLLGAIESFAPTIQQQRCIDVGASTGGFTQVLLKAGAEFVAALDVGHDQLHNDLKYNPRVQSFEGINFRNLDKDLAKELQAFDLLTMDVSFISVLLLKDSIKQVLKPQGEAIILIKPQFEAGRGALNKAGVVTDPKRHQAVLMNVVSAYLKDGFSLKGLIYSPLQGPDGNIEYLAYFKRQPDLVKQGTKLVQAGRHPVILTPRLGTVGSPRQTIYLSRPDRKLTTESSESFSQTTKATILKVVEEGFKAFELPHHP